MDDMMALAKLRLEEILTFFGVNAKVKAEVNEDTLELMVDAEDTGRLIGRRGETLAALQQLINAIVRGASTEHIYVSIDIGNYKKGRAEHLTEQAKLDAQQVIESGEAKRLAPMNAAERRVVHMALADIPEVETESEGDGRNRRVIIKRRSDK